jgi:hypothetical protein
VGARAQDGGPVAKNKDDARAEGFKRGLKGKRDSAGVTQGWTDDKAATAARSDGWMAGKRKRSQLAAAEVKAGRKS